MLRNAGVCLVLILSSWSLSAQSAQTLGPGNIQLLPGYLDTRMRPIDSAGAGRISKADGVLISYDIGLAAGHYETHQEWADHALWRTDQVINGKRVVCIYTKSKQLLVTFPDDLANFYAKIRAPRDLADMMLMVLTYGSK